MEQIKKTPISKEIKVILLTILKNGYVVPEEKEMLYTELKMNGYGSMDDYDLSILTENEKKVLLDVARKFQE